MSYYLEVIPDYITKKQSDKKTSDLLKQKLYTQSTQIKQLENPEDKDEESDDDDT